MHAHESLLRNAYAAFGRGDLAGIETLCRPDLMLRVPGTGLLSGNHTWQEFVRLLGPAMAAVGGSFHEEVRRVLVAEHEGAVFVAQRADRAGRRYTWNAVHWWDIREGKLAAFHEFIDDSAAFEAAWRR